LGSYAFLPAMPAPHPSDTNMVVYTVITNNYETLRNPDVIDPRITYICFTDQPLWLAVTTNNDSVWQIKKIPGSNLDPARKSRQVKILPHLFIGEHDCRYSVYIDGNINIIGDIFELLAANAGYQYLGFRHPFRDCIYQELETCIDMRKDDPEIMGRQIGKYRKEGFPEHFGLFENNVLIRKHHDADVVKLMESWWREVNAHSRRDQLSLPYVIWRQNFHIRTMGHDNARGNSQYFCARPGWRTTPTDPKWKILWDKYLGWRIRRLLEE